MSSLNRMEDLHMHGVPIELRERLGRLTFWIKNHVENGLVIAAPTTPSSTADAGPFDFNVNISAGMVSIGSHRDEPTAAADVNVASGAGASPILAAKPDITYTIVAKEVVATHAITYVAVAGAAATVGASVAPSATVIQTAVGAGNNWVRLGTTTVHRATAATMTQTYANTVKPTIE